jgi:hypothetical protein
MLNQDIQDSRLIPTPTHVSNLVNSELHLQLILSAANVHAVGWNTGSLNTISTFSGTTYGPTAGHDVTVTCRILGHETKRASHHYVESNEINTDISERFVETLSKSGNRYFSDGVKKASSNESHVRSVMMTNQRLLLV